MICEGLMLLDPTPKDLTAGVTPLISTNVYDAGSAKKVFGGHSLRPPVLCITYKITAGTGTLSFRYQFIGAEAADLTTGAEEVIADTGIQLLDTDGTALAIGDVISYAIPLVGQRSAKRYYGGFSTQGTADQDGELTVVITEGPQTNMPYFRAAIPA
jgi:hypothetical protein